MRAILCVLDSLGVGSAADAGRDAGADTFGHVAEACARGEADRAGLRSGPLQAPNLVRLGLGLAAEASRGHSLPLERPSHVAGLWGYAREVSRGKDTPSGHWEMLGAPVDYDWGYFPEADSFPPELLEGLAAEAGLPGVLGNRHASGTTIIEELGEEHIATGKPIVYTSADSVFQIAAHETHFGLQRLYEVSEIARGLVDKYNVGRVIARPFVGEGRGSFKRTTNRRDYATPPHVPTLLERAMDAGRETIAIGKVSDIFAHQGVKTKIKAGDNLSVFEELTEQISCAPDGSLIVANFNDFDTLYGHRRDVVGYAAALEQFDGLAPRIEAMLAPGDLVILSADHGCDPTWPGSDHTREHVPVIAFGPDIHPGPIGARDSFADIGQTLAQHLGLPPLASGKAFL
jgi:phosphopentomutase